MELRHLRTVVAIARHGSFTKAGEELHLAQSAVSQQLRLLEAELGITLFTRSSRNVEITPEGTLVLDYARRVLSEVDGLRDELDEMAGLLRGDLRLGGMWPTGLYDLYAVIADFHDQHPGVAIHFVEGTQEELLAQIRADELDAICTEMGAVRALVSKGMGIAVIPRSAAEEAGPPIELRPIGPHPFTWPVALVWRGRRRQPPAAKAFLSLAIARAQQAPPVRLAA
jgi:DNA-binding transcriptional LysR family regulator